MGPGPRDGPGYRPFICPWARPRPVCFTRFPPGGDGRGGLRPSVRVSPSMGHRDRAFRSSKFLEGTAAYPPFSGKERLRSGRSIV
jgi:hypothetical protein